MADRKRIDYPDASPYFGFTESWRAVNSALFYGGRGFLGGSSLHALLIRHGLKVEKPGLTEEGVRAAADAFCQKHKSWPDPNSGNATEFFGYEETWTAVNASLVRGGRGLPGGGSLRALRVRSGMSIDKPNLTEGLIIEAARRHKDRTGSWPSSKGGPADFGYPDGDYASPETWKAVDACLFKGTRGLPGGSSLHKLLMESGLTERILTRILTEESILAAAQAHFLRTGKWPSRLKGGDATEDFGWPETWLAVDGALRIGGRGLPRQTTLATLLHEARLKEDQTRYPLSESEIIEAAEKFRNKNGKYPTQLSGDASSYFGRKESWPGVNGSLRLGKRGLPGGSSLVQLLHDKGLRINPLLRPELTREAVLSAVRAYIQEVGDVPSAGSGDATRYFGYPTSWSAVAASLSRGGTVGSRGYPERTTLIKVARLVRSEVA